MKSKKWARRRAKRDTILEGLDKVIKRAKAINKEMYLGLLENRKWVASMLEKHPEYNEKSYSD